MSAHASQLYLCRHVDATMALRRSSRIKQSCCSGTGKAKQQEQKKLRLSSKAGKNTVPTEETQVEELTEQNTTGKTKQQEQKRLRSSLKAVKNTVPTEDTQVEELTEQIKSTFRSKFPPNYYRFLLYEYPLLFHQIKSALSFSFLMAFLMAFLQLPFLKNQIPQSISLRVCGPCGCFEVLIRQY